MKKLLFMLLTIGLMATACKTDDPDPCEDIVCNNGTCADAACVCDPGWEGTNCNAEIKPTKMKLISFKLVDIPELDSNGEEWDPEDNSAPDINVSIYSPAPNTFLLYEATFPNYSESELEVELGLDFFFEEVDESYYFTIGDVEENTSTTSMGNAFLTPYDEGSGFPTKLDIAPLFADKIAELEVEYIWE